MTTPAVVVVAYGDPAHLSACLRALGAGHDVVIVDNGKDARVAELARQHAAAYLDPGRNLGFAAGVNHGLATIEAGRDVLLLNPDARLAGADVAVLQGALHAMPRVAAVSPALRYPDGTAQRVAWPLPGVAQVWRDALALTPPSRCFLIGAVLLLNGAALVDLGHLDERFFLYAEEADWQERALRAGWTVKLVDSVTAVHIGSATSVDDSQRQRLFRESNDIYARKWLGPCGYRAHRLGSLLAAGRRSLRPRG